MPTECSATLFEFEAVEGRSVVAGFDGGNITSNAGALLLGQVDCGLGLVRRFAECFIDRRDPRYVEVSAQPGCSTDTPRRIVCMAWYASMPCRAAVPTTDRTLANRSAAQLDRNPPVTFR